MKEENPNAADT
uniref:Uncharacterized protein n=1 Tax=Setaria italica TaxID=4555 RepID=K3ZCV3_SETIT